MTIKANLEFVTTLEDSGAFNSRICFIQSDLIKIRNLLSVLSEHDVNVESVKYEAYVK